jgi:hypothetical protein
VEIVWALVALLHAGGLFQRLDSALLAELLDTFSERGLVVVASTIAQVNFCTRAIEGPGGTEF